MSAPLRIQALALPVGELAPVEKFCRWALGMKAAEEATEEGTRVLGWGREDRVRLIDAAATGVESEEAVVLRMSAAPLGGVVEWCAERAVRPVSVAVVREDVEAAEAAWPGSAVVAIEEEARQNQVVVSVRGPVPPRLDLFFPLPKESVVARGRMGPFTWGSRDRRDLEVPGLLGVTAGAPDPTAMREFLTGLGIGEMAVEEGPAPLGIGDHQWILEERDPPGIYGYAVVVPAARVRDLARTMGHLEVDHRLDEHRLIAADPAGRVVLVHGVRAA